MQSNPAMLKCSKGPKVQLGLVKVIRFHSPPFGSSLHFYLKKLQGIVCVHSFLSLVKTMRRSSAGVSLTRKVSERKKCKNKDEDRTYNILTFDSGGCLGILEAYMLQDLMNMATILKDSPNKLFKVIVTNDRETLLAKPAARQKMAELITEVKHPIHPTEVFDMIAGSSTGALIAFGLVGGKTDVHTGLRIPMSITDVINMYLTVFPKVFKDFTGWKKLKNALARKIIGIQIDPYDTEIVKHNIEGYFGQSTLQDLDVGIPSVALATVTRMGHNAEESYDGTEIFDSKSSLSIKVTDVLMATTNAPVYFKTPWYIRGVPYADGAIGASCPLGPAIARMQDLTNGQLQSALSIGPPRDREDTKKGTDSFNGLKFWLSYFTKRPSDGFQSYLETKAHHPLGHCMRLSARSESLKLEANDIRFQFMFHELGAEKQKDPRYLQDTIISAIPIATRAMRTDANCLGQLWQVAKYVMKWTFHTNSAEKGLYIANAFGNIPTQNKGLKCEFDIYLVWAYYQLNLFITARDKSEDIHLPVECTKRPELESSLLTLRGKIHFQLGRIIFSNNKTLLICNYISISLGNYHESEQLLKQSLSILNEKDFDEKSSAEALMCMSKIKQKLYKADEALINAQKAVEMDDNMETILNKSDILLSIKKHDEVGDILQQVVVKDDNKMMAKKATLLGRWFLEKGKVKEAITQHCIAVDFWNRAHEEEEDPDMIQAYHYAGQAYIRSSDLPKGLIVLEQAVMAAKKMYAGIENHPQLEVINQAVAKARKTLNGSTGRKSSDIEGLRDNGNVRSYPQRWWIVSTVVLLNIANFSQLVAFPSVANIAAEHYHQSEQRMDYIPILHSGAGIPFCIMTMIVYVVENHGLQTGLKITGTLTFIGGLMCFVSSAPKFWMSYFSKYYLALVGQVLMGIATSFLDPLMLRINQLCFDENQRMLATTFMSMSSIVGLILGQFVTPMVTRTPSDIPLLNGLWFIPALVGFVLAMIKNKSVVTPSSQWPLSLGLKQQNGKGMEFWLQVKQLFTNGHFLLLLLFIGGGTGYITAISTKISQILTSLGYTPQFAGGSGSLVFVAGLLASFVFGVISHKLKKPVLLLKLGCPVVFLALGIMNYSMKLEDEQPFILISSALVGILLIGFYPIALDLIVECTYPADQVIFSFHLSSNYKFLFFLRQLPWHYYFCQVDFKVLF